MSNYIRTKTGIYKVIKNELFGECIKIDGGYIMLDNIYDYVINQADTIVELCDGFYLDDKLLNRFNKYAVFKKEELKKFTELFIYYKKGNIPVVAYGFIKTDKGLIFVAEMNETGELKLI